MDKQYVLFELETIRREITCMNEGDFNKSVDEDVFDMKFVRYRFGKPYKTLIEIKMVVEQLDNMI